MNEQATSATQITQAIDSVRRGAIDTARALAEQATAATQVTGRGRAADEDDRRRRQRDGGAGDGDGADRRRRRRAIRRQTDQTNKGMAEQARAAAELTTATRNVAKQMALITRANKEQAIGGRGVARNAHATRSGLGSQRRRRARATPSALSQQLAERARSLGQTRQLIS